MSTTMDFTSWQMEDVFVTPKGAKICRVSNKDGDECLWTPGAAMAAPFGPSSFDKDPNARRQSLDFVLADPVVREQASALDAWAVEYISTHSERLLKKPMTMSQVQTAYNSCVREAKDPKFHPKLKCKVDLEGKHALCLWDDQGHPVPYPSNWRDVELKAVIRVSHLWIMGAAFGLVLQVTDAQLFPKESSGGGPRENPFKR